MKEKLSARVGVCADAAAAEEAAGIRIAVAPEIVCFVSREDRCRGPICSAVYQSAGDGSRKAVSCGLDAEDCGDVPPLTIEVLREAGYIDPENTAAPRSRRADPAVLECCHAVYAVDEEIAMRLILGYPQLASKIRCLGGQIAPAAFDTADEYRRVLKEAEKLIGGLTGGEI